MKYGLLLFASFGLIAGGPGKHLGQPFKVSEVTSLQQIASQPDKYVGKAVRVKGKVTEVCEMMGCWMNLTDADGKHPLRVKVNDGEIVFPKEAIGKVVETEGKLAKMELTKEQAIARAKHEAEEQGRQFKADSVKGPVTIYQLQGSGALIPAG